MGAVNVVCSNPASVVIAMFCFHYLTRSKPGCVVEKHQLHLPFLAPPSQWRLVVQAAFPAGGWCRVCGGSQATAPTSSEPLAAALCGSHEFSLGTRTPALLSALTVPRQPPCSADAELHRSLQLGSTSTYAIALHSCSEVSHHSSNWFKQNAAQLKDAPSVFITTMK